MMDPNAVKTVPKGKKRKEPPTHAPDPKSRPTSKQQRFPKRPRFLDARKIDSQPGDAALKDGELDLQAFMDARTFEIEALEASMHKSASSKSRRAFQSVPREMRRRTASHNAKRVPKRLRARAKKEMATDNTPTVSQKRRPRSTRARLRAETAQKLGLLIKRKKQQIAKAAEDKGEPMDLDTSQDKPVPIVTRKPRPKIRRDALNDPPKPKSKFRKRQRDKTWLPTHLWHAKRATMSKPKEPKWGFAMPMTPTQKAYRTTHRAITQSGGVVAWDTSYMSTIAVYGLEKGLEALIREVCCFTDDEWKSKGALWKAGCQPTYTWLCRRMDEGKRRLIAPITIIFSPKLPPRRPSRPKTGQPEKDSRREVFIRVHPSAFSETWDVFSRATKKRKGMYIEDLRYEIGSIELMGSNATEAMRAILQPYWTVKRDRELDVDYYRNLNPNVGPENQPGLPIFGLCIADPRLKFPSKPLKDKSPVPKIAAMNIELVTWLKMPSDGPHALFDRKVRQTAVQDLPSKKSVDKRRGETAPNKSPAVIPSDPPIPIIAYIQREPSRWVVLAPFKLIETIWPCLMKCPLSTSGQVRFGGIQEQQQAIFESQLGWFPADFPTTRAGLTWELEEREHSIKAWERRPKSKRPEWGTVDLGLGRRGELGNGLACDWEFLLKLPSLSQQPGAPKAVTASEAKEGGEEEDQVRTDADQAAATKDVKKTKSASRNAKDVKDGLLKEMVRVLRPEYETLLINSRRGQDTEVPEHGVINVRIKMSASGTVSRCARIYRLPATTPVTDAPLEVEVPATQAPPKHPVTLPVDLREQWLSQTPSRKKAAEKEAEELLKQRRQAKKSRQKKGGRKSDPDGGDGAQTQAALERQQDVAEVLFTQPGLPLLTQLDKPAAGTLNGHPFVPNEEDLIGFVTTGSFNLRVGQPTALGSISVVKVKEDLRRYGLSDTATCIIRNAGENVGRLARWEVI